MITFRTPDAFMIDPEPAHLGPHEFDQVLMHAVNHGASDIDLINGDPVWAQIEGKRWPIMRRPVSDAELRTIVNYMNKAEAATRVTAGNAVNISHEIQVDRLVRRRFRVNVIGTLVNGRDAMQVTIRSLPRDLPTMKALNIEQEIINNFTPHNGIVLVTGPTGSGKSTLLAGGIHDVVSDPEAHRKITTLEAPIEFTYDTVNRSTSLITQTEVGRHIKSFHQGVVECMRRKPEVILVGESRDVETMEASLEASNTGHLVYTTLHSNGVPETIRRIVNFFPQEERDGRAIDIAESMRMIVTQNLLPGADGKRVAVREYLVFTPDIRENLAGLPITQWTSEIRRLVQERGQSMFSAVRKVHEEGRLDERTWRLWQGQATLKGAA